MYKKILIIASMVLVLVGLSAVLPARQTEAAGDITICHRSNSATNPYQVLTVSQSSVDGIAGNSGNEADHYGEHKGPLASSQSVAEDLKKNKIDWGDIIPPISGIHSGLNWTTAGQAIYNNGCQYTTEVIPAAATFVGSTCDVRDGSYTIPVTAGIDYYVGDDTEPTAAGTYPVTSDETITIIAVAKTGYSIKDGATYQWSYAFNIKTDEECRQPATKVTPASVTFVDSTCEVRDGSYTIPTTEGVKYYVNGSITATVAGTYPITQDTSITVQAIADAGYEIESGATDLWSHGFHIKTDLECVLGTESVTPEAVIFTAPTCDKLGYYTVPEMQGVKYYVNGQVVDKGKHVVANGTTVTINAVAEEGFSIKEGATNQWTYTFTAPTNCGGGGSVLGATNLPNTSGDMTAASVTIISVAATFITILGAVIRSLMIRQL